MKRRAVLTVLCPAALGSLVLEGCGFRLRGPQTYTFQRLAILPNPGGPLTLELRRSLGSAVHVLAVAEPLVHAQVVLDILQEQREKTVVGVNASGQVREFQLRTRVRFRIRTPQGEELVPSSEISQKRDINFSESAALAKEAEEALLYRDMQSDMVQQLLRRLAAVQYAVGP